MISQSEAKAARLVGQQKRATDVLNDQLAGGERKTHPRPPGRPTNKGHGHFVRLRSFELASLLHRIRILLRGPRARFDSEQGGSRRQTIGSGLEFCWRLVVNSYTAFRSR